MHRRSLVCAGALMGVAGASLAKGRDFRVGALVLAATMTVPEIRGKFRELLAQHGMVAGTDYTMVLGIPDESGDFGPPARQLAGDRVDVIVAMGGTPSVVAAMQAAPNIPIVMWAAPDPVGDHLVTSLAHPGGNVTGVCTFGVELVTKRMQLLAEVLGKPTSIGYLKFENEFVARYAAYERALTEAAGKDGIRMEFVTMRDLPDVEGAFDELRRRGVDGVVLDNPARFMGQVKRIASLALDRRLPAIADGWMFPQAGLLMSYGPDYFYAADRAASYVVRIWKGAQPRDLPVELIAKFDMNVNAATAEALGIRLPQAVTVMASHIYR
ncbi:MAG: ABC transporter substrate-binding protein [Proteobacteria bacterium]|nr:ABC transporter substrate-binding protein [Pseudomonadota bacterium]